MARTGKICVAMTQPKLLQEDFKAAAPVVHVTKTVSAVAIAVPIPFSAVY